MKFNEALKMMKQGVPMKLPSWGGYWCWDNEKETIMMHTKDNQVLDIRETQRVEYTLSKVCSDEWIPATEENTPILGGVATFSFSEALNYLKRGLKVARNGWNAKDQFITLLDPYSDPQFTLQEIAPYGTFYPHLVIKTNYNAVVPWFPSATDVLAEDWVFADVKEDEPKKKLFISQPMKGKTDEEILAVREQAIKSAKNLLGEEVEVIDSFFQNAPFDAQPLWYLGKSLELLSTADVVYFAKDWEKFRGCKIENDCAIAYGITIIEDYK